MYHQTLRPSIVDENQEVTPSPPSRKTTKSLKNKSNQEKGRTKIKLDEDSSPAIAKKDKLIDVTTYWVVDSDDLVLQRTTDSGPEFLSKESVVVAKGSISNEASNDHGRDEMASLLKFTIRGNPLPLRRHRTSRGFVYNPSAANQKSFRESVEGLVFQGLTGSNVKAPLWGPEHVLAVSIIFRMKRPNSHFISNKRGPERLRSSAPRQTSGAMRTDVDNLAKFVLDSLNGLLYADDRQIASLHVTKLFDNDFDGECQGSTCVCVRLLRDKDISQLLVSSMALY